RVRFYVLDPGTREAGVLDGPAHRQHRAVRLRMNVRDAIGVGRVTVAKHLAQDRGAALARVIELLENERASSLGDDEAAALSVERTGRRRRGGVALRQRLEEDEPGEPQVGQRC